MDVITKDELRFKQEEVMDRILGGEVFIYPTDTIYGIGCDARNSEAVKKIRDIKQRVDSPFSVLVPSEGWIRENCVITPAAEEWLSQLPGALTLIFKTLDSPVADEIAPGLDSVGCRIPDHWFSVFVQKLGFPIVTTSVNVSDQPFMTSLDDLDDSIKQKVDFCVYEGPKQGRPSKIVRLDQNNVHVRER